MYVFFNLDSIQPHDASTHSVLLSQELRFSISKQDIYPSKDVEEYGNHELLEKSTGTYVLPNGQKIINHLNELHQAGYQLVLYSRRDDNLMRLIWDCLKKTSKAKDLPDFVAYGIYAPELCQNPPTSPRLVRFGNEVLACFWGTGRTADNGDAHCALETLLHITPEQKNQNIIIDDALTYFSPSVTLNDTSNQRHLTNTHPFRELIAVILSLLVKPILYILSFGSAYFDETVIPAFDEMLNRFVHPETETIPSISFR